MDCDKFGDCNNFSCLVLLCGQTHRQTDRHTDRQTDRQRDRQTERQTDRQTDTYHTQTRPIAILARQPLASVITHHIYSTEKVQKKFTKRLPGCNSLAYIERRN